MASKQGTSVLSVYVPKRKRKDRLVERLNRLATRQDRSVNYLVVQAVLQYLDREAPVAV